jgi:hypothetical protein
MTDRSDGSGGLCDVQWSALVGWVVLLYGSIDVDNVVQQGPEQDVRHQTGRQAIQPQARPRREITLRTTTQHSTAQHTMVSKEWLQRAFSPLPPFPRCADLDLPVESVAPDEGREEDGQEIESEAIQPSQAKDASDTASEDGEGPEMGWE